MLTLEEFANQHIKPWLLEFAGLPDTPEGRDALETFVAAVLKAEREQVPGG